MKKLIFTLILLCMSLPLFYANDIISIQEGNWTLTVNAEAMKVMLLFTFLVFCFMILSKALSFRGFKRIKRYEFSFKFSPKELLFRRYVREEISFEKFVKLQKEIRCVISDIEKYKIVASAKSDISAISGKS